MSLVVFYCILLIGFLIDRLCVSMLLDKPNLSFLEQSKKNKMKPY